MKYLIIVLTSITLSGCFWQTANNVDLRKAVYFCGGIENVEYITIALEGSEKIKCFNGKVEFADAIVIPEKGE